MSPVFMTAGGAGTGAAAGAPAVLIDDHVLVADRHIATQLRRLTGGSVFGPIGDPFADTIVFDAGVIGTITLVTDELRIDKTCQL